MYACCMSVLCDCVMWCGVVMGPSLIFFFFSSSFWFLFSLNRGEDLQKRRNHPRPRLPVLPADHRHPPHHQKAPRRMTSMTGSMKNQVRE